MRGVSGETYSVQVLGGAECVIFGHAAFIQKEARSECEDCANLSSLFTEICCTDIFTASNDSLLVPVYHRATWPQPHIPPSPLSGRNPPLCLRVPRLPNVPFLHPTRTELPHCGTAVLGTVLWEWGIWACGEWEDGICEGCRDALWEERDADPLQPTHGSCSCGLSNGRMFTGEQRWFVGGGVRGAALWIEQNCVYLCTYVHTYVYMCNSLVICTLIFRHFENSSIRMLVAISALPLSPPLLSLSLHLLVPPSLAPGCALPNCSALAKRSSLSLATSSKR